MKNHETEKNTQTCKRLLHLHENPLKSFWYFLQSENYNGVIVILENRDNLQPRANKNFLLGTTGQLRSPGLDGASSIFIRSPLRQQPV